MVLIGFLAKKHSGKDTVADYLVNENNFEKMSLATPLKKAIGILFGFSDDQLYGNLKEDIDERWGTSPRIVMQYLGTEVFRHSVNKIIPGINDDFWIRSLIVNYNNLLKSNPKLNVAVADVRFQNEVDGIHKNGGIIIKIVRPCINNEKDQHDSEKSIDKIENYDELLVNDGSLEELYLKVNQLVKNRNLVS
jgi:hypothetical protein